MSITNLTLRLVLTQTAKKIAQVFAAQQPTPQKQQQVQLNTLAVCLMNDYLQKMKIQTDLASGDSWNPVLRLCSDVADLLVVGVGRLECRPIMPKQTVCVVPPEVWEDRIGYVVVEIDTLHRKANLLGFASRVTSDELPLNQLQPPRKLISYLQKI